VSIVDDMFTKIQSHNSFKIEHNTIEVVLSKFLF
jgi:hypothetical protein